MLEYIDLTYFLMAFCLGLVYTYWIVPQPQIIIRYPTPFNAGHIVYTDRNHSCYTYQLKKDICPLDQSKIKYFVVQ